MTQHSVRIGVRSYELDALGHLNQAVYHSYAEHGRVEFFRAAGCPSQALFAQGIAPVLLASNARYLRELRADDEVEVSTAIEFGAGKTFTMPTRITRVDGVLAATIDTTMGIMDLTARRLIPDPHARLTEIAPSLAEPTRDVG